MIGFVLVPIGLLALYGTVARTRAEPAALAAVVTGWVGAGLTLPYYGAEDFGLHAVGRAAADGFLPQFFAPPAARIAHGVLLGAGCVRVAWAAIRSAGRTCACRCAAYTTTLSR